MSEDPNVLYPKPAEQYITDFKFSVYILHYELPVM